MDHDRRRRIITAFTLSLFGLVLAVAVAIDGTGTVRYYSVFTGPETLGDGHIVDNVNNTGYIDFLDVVNLSMGGISNDFRPNAYPLTGDDWPPTLGNYKNLGNEIETWGFAYFKEWCNGTGSGDCLTYTAVKNGLGGGASFPSIIDDGNNITLLKNVSMATNANITLKGAGIMNFPDVKTTFGQSVLFSGFFGFEAFNDTVYNADNFLGGFYSPQKTGTSSDKNWFIGYGSSNMSILFCSDAGGCNVVINNNYNNVPSNNSLVFTNAGYSTFKQRWRMHLSQNTTQNNDLYIEFNDSTSPPANLGGSLLLRPRNGASFGVHVEAYDKTNTTLNVNGTIRQERAVYINNSALNACSGVITLSAGQGWVNTTCVVANSIILLTTQNCVSPPTCQPSIKDRAIGKSFNITSLVNDTTQVGWVIIEAR